MSILYIRAINSVFDTRDEGHDYARPEDALALGVRSAIAMVAEEVNSGMPSCAIEISVEAADARPILRAVVSLSVSSLHIG